MKKEIHPSNYREVVFKDIGADVTWKVRSTVKTDRTITWEDGQEYPLYTLEISSASHPHFTGVQRFVDSEGRVERFQKKYAAKKAGGKKAVAKKPEAKKAEPAKAEAKPAKKAKPAPKPEVPVEEAPKAEIIADSPDASTAEAKQ